MKLLKNFFVLALALVAIGCGLLAWTQYQELIKLRAELMDPNAKADLARQLASAQRRVRTLQDELASLRAQRARGGAGVAQADDPAGQNPRRNRGGPGGGFGGGFGGFRALMNNPEFQKLQAVQIKGQIDARYAPLFRQLNLSPEQQSQLENLLVQRQEAPRDVMAAAQQQGINPRTDPQAFQQAIADAQSSIDQQVQSLLGDSSYAAYQQYQQTMPQRNTVSQVQQLLSFSGTPLTDDQANQLVQLMAQDAAQSQQAGQGNQVFAARGAGGFGAGGAGPIAPITAQDLTMAQSILSGPQLQALQQVQQQQQAQQQMIQLMRASRQNAGGGGG